MCSWTQVLSFEIFRICLFNSLLFYLYSDIEIIANAQNVDDLQVWNDTVANLTLMALGSSSPEILLSCIEIIGRGFRAGDLGPGTIVGSAAFNLFCITAVCVVIIPTPETRRIDAIGVFLVTTVFSLFAYVWLVVILVVSSPNVVELWEAILTFLFAPVLVVLAYLVDTNPRFCAKKTQPQLSKNDVALEMEIGREF